MERDYACWVQFLGSNVPRLCDKYLYRDTGGNPDLMMPFLHTISGLTTEEAFSLFRNFLGFGYPDNQVFYDGNHCQYSYYIYMDIGIVQILSSDRRIDNTYRLEDGTEIHWGNSGDFIHIPVRYDNREHTFRYYCPSTHVSIFPFLRALAGLTLDELIDLFDSFGWYMPCDDFWIEGARIYEICPTTGIVTVEGPDILFKFIMASGQILVFDESFGGWV